MSALQKTTTFAACALAFALMHPAHAADTATRKNVRQLAERLIQCKGSNEDLAVFNRWVIRSSSVSPRTRGMNPGVEGPGRSTSP